MQGLVENMNKESSDRRSLLLAILAGTISTSLMVFLWYMLVKVTEYQLSILSVVVGPVIAFSVYLVTKKRGLRFQLLASVLTLIAILFTELLIFRYMINLNLIDEGKFLPLILPLNAYFAMLTQRIMLIRNTGAMTFLYWSISILSAWLILWDKNGKTDSSSSGVLDKKIEKKTPVKKSRRKNTVKKSSSKKQTPKKTFSKKKAPRKTTKKKSIRKSKKKE